MKKLNLFLMGLITASVLVFSGCEAGLTSNDGSDNNSEEHFSFSNIYSRMNSLEEEIKSLNKVNLEQAVLIEKLEASIGSVSISDLNAIAVRLDKTFSEDTVYKSGNNIIFDSVNVQIVSGSGTTDGAVNGVGNLIVGYNEERAGGSGANIRTGSHNIVVGRDHNFYSYGGIVAGYSNSIQGIYSCVTGGRNNGAYGAYASVNGGAANNANGNTTGILGGSNNSANNDYATVGGGRMNEASGHWAHVSGGNIRVGSTDYNPY